MNTSQRGSHILIVVVIVAIIAIIAGLAFVVISNSSDKDTDSTKQTDGEHASIWQQRENGWESTETPPECPSQPMLKAPADLSKVTSVLYPGQTRGQYKPHGGLRFDNSTDNKATVTAPMDGTIVKATRNFAEGTTEVQYGLDIMNDCGIMVRFGHFNEVPANFKAMYDALPEASASSLPENVNPPVHVKQGDILATKVGLISENNTFFDWGVYDYRQQNEASQSEAYQLAHPQKELAWYAVCWLRDWLPVQDTEALALLPSGGGENGRTSDYCK